MTDRASLRAQGEAMRRRLFGDGDDGAPANMRTLNTEAIYGAIWSRPGLALDDRMVCALAALGAVQRLPKLGRHVGAALDLGLSARAIVEILVQIGIYAGFAASEEAVAAAGAVFAARSIAMPDETAREDSLEALTTRGRDLMQQLHGERATRRLRRARQQGHGRALSAGHPVRLRRDLVPSRPRPAAAGAGRGGGVHRAAARRAGEEVRPVGAQHGPEPHRGDRGGDPDRAAQRLRPCPQCARRLERGAGLISARAASGRARRAARRRTG